MSTLKIKNNQGTWDYIQLAGPDAFQDAVKYYTATGSANTYAITTSPTFSSLTEGYGVAIKIPVNSTGASTLNVNSIGAKPIKKADGANVTNLKAGGVYTLRYDGTNFILQGEGASGNATASDLLSGKTATTDAGEIVGTMTNRGAVNQSLAINGTYTIPAGYHNGSGKVTQSITTKAAQTFTPGTTNQTIAAGQYLSGVQTILGDADLIAENIRSGVSVFGVTGNVKEGGTIVSSLEDRSGSYIQKTTLTEHFNFQGSGILQSSSWSVPGGQNNSGSQTHLASIDGGAVETIVSEIREGQSGTANHGLYFQNSLVFYTRGVGYSPYGSWSAVVRTLSVE